MVGAVRWLLDVLFPQTCPGCANPSDVNGLCPDCLSATAVVRPPLCTICGIPFRGAGRDHVCSACLRRPPHFHRARACAVYGERPGSRSPLAAALHRYKYLPDVTLAPALGAILVERCPLVVDHDLVVPVPLHLRRLRRRGFNHAQLLARPFARHHGIALDPFALQRVRHTAPQVGRSERDRRRNLAGAFAVRHPATIDRRVILLVDDVYTTGATVDECARTLRRAGARRVDVLTLAHVQLG